MTPQEIDRFFRTLSRQWDGPLKVILTGAAAGAVWGCVRPSVDIDFAVEPAGKGERVWRGIEEALRRTTALTGIPANYAQDIDRWGQISLLDYKRHASVYKRFGSVRVYTLEPAYWSIGKVTRYLDPDIEDLVAALSRRKVPARRLAGLWGEALRKSPPSAERFQFRRHVEDFLRAYGRKIWGAAFDPQPVLKEFYRRAGIEEGPLSSKSRLLRGAT